MTRWLQPYLMLIEPGRRARWVGVIVLAIVVSGMEATGAILVFGLVSLTTDPSSNLEVPVLGDVSRWLPDMPHDQLVLVSAIGVAAFFLVRAVIVLGQRYYETRTTQLTGVDISVRLLQRYLRLPYSFHLRRNSAELIRNANDSITEILGSVLTPVVRIITHGLTIVAMVAVLVATAPLATLLASALLLPLVLVTLRVVQPRTKRLGRISQREGKRSYQALQQSLHGYRDITVLGRQDFFLEAFRDARATIAMTRFRRAVLSSFPRVSIEAAVICFIAGFVALSALLGDGSVRSLPVLGLFAYAALRIMPALNHVVSSLNAMRFGRAALDDVQADLTLPIPPPPPDVTPLPFERELRLTGIEFRYEGTDRSTLHDIDLVVERGESIGIVGATGAGKSTLVDLIVGLSSPTTGTVTIDGVDLAGNEPAWQRNIGLVSQQVFLLDDTLRRNIALGVADHDIDESQVLEAVRLAQLEDFVASLPDGLDTEVGERGVRVSGGQRQRVAIARALYRRPAVLVFDEGTSALDNLTEAALTEALAQLRVDHTLVTVAHRLSTVQSYDRIVLMHEGRIVDIGRFDELTHRSETFRRLARWSDSAV
ncbi:ABC transporter ATP-binding protein [Nitriliruptor alkaliphilus]|uniref:ABC transporter ATP-binding protein n=1 Tax=Nitriliruptor alkaliphilus TaxID=427918 RepID=UPI0006986F22|nr:ABC transporter ATP-binding protein [Nitriliruptor alkaliphilus]